LKADNARPLLVNIGALGNLGKLFSHAPSDAPSVNAADFKSDQLSRYFPPVFKEPVSVLLSLHSADNSPALLLVRKD